MQTAERLNGHARALVPPLPLPRRAEPTDIPQLLDLAAELYAVPFDRGIMGAWLMQAIAHPNYLVLLGHDAAAVALADPPPFRPTVPDVRVLYFLGRSVWEVIRLLRQVALFAKGVGAAEVRLEAVNGQDIDPICRRLGAMVDPTPAYFWRV